MKNSLQEEYQKQVDQTLLKEASKSEHKKRDSLLCCVQSDY